MSLTNGFGLGSSLLSLTVEKKKRKKKRESVLMRVFGSCSRMYMSRQGCKIIISMIFHRCLNFDVGLCSEQ